MDGWEEPNMDGWESHSVAAAAAAAVEAEAEDAASRRPSDGPAAAAAVAVVSEQQPRSVRAGEREAIEARMRRVEERTDKERRRKEEEARAALEEEEAARRRRMKAYAAAEEGRQQRAAQRAAKADARRAASREGSGRLSDDKDEKQKVPLERTDSLKERRKHEVLSRTRSRTRSAEAESAHLSRTRSRTPSTEAESAQRQDKPSQRRLSVRSDIRQRIVAAKRLAAATEAEEAAREKVRCTRVVECSLSRAPLLLVVNYISVREPPAGDGPARSERATGRGNRARRGQKEEGARDEGAREGPGGAASEERS